MDRSTVDILEVPFPQWEMVRDGEPIAMNVEVGGAIAGNEKVFDGGQEKEGQEDA